MNERNLLADTAKIVEKNKVCKRKDDICRTVVTDLLFALGYDASVCKSRWEKTPSYPSGTLSLHTLQKYQWIRHRFTAEKMYEAKKSDFFLLILRC